MTNRVYVMTLLVVLVLAALAQAQTFTVLYDFTGGPDGGIPEAGVIQDRAGNLYGSAETGGSSGYGVVYKLDTAGTETVLYSFCSQTNCADGEYPEAPVLRDQAGNLYGTTSWGGSSRFYGVVFKIDTAGNETVLYSFTGGSDGCYPEQGLVEDKAGNLYGTTGGCGASGDGTVFNVDSSGNFTLLHTFTGSDGDGPYGGHLTMDKSGNLYGVTFGGGAYGFGALYKLSKDRTLTLLHSFNGGGDGCGPDGTVVRDKHGNLYGTTMSYICGPYDGAIWKLSEQGKEITILHNFVGGTSDGCFPEEGVTRDAKGNLYGVTYECGAKDFGVLYELSAKGGLTLLHSFDGASHTGRPVGGVWRTANGTLYGTTFGSQKCRHGCGTVWSYVP